MWEDSTKRFFLAHGRPFQPCQKMAWRWQTLCQVSCWDEFTLSHGSYVHLHLYVAPRPWTYRTVDQGAPAAAKRPQPMRKPKWFDSQFCQGLSPLNPAQSLCATWKDHKLVINDPFFIIFWCKTSGKVEDGESQLDTGGHWAVRQQYWLGHLLGIKIIKVFDGICVYLYYLLLRLSCTIF